MKTTFTTKIKGCSLTARPVNNYRSTKSGKRIMTGDPCFMMNLQLDIKHADGMSVGNIYVDLEGTQFAYLTFGTLTSVKQIHTAQVIIKTGSEITLILLGRTFNEASNNPT